MFTYIYIIEDCREVCYDKSLCLCHSRLWGRLLINYIFGYFIRRRRDVTRNLLVSPLHARVYRRGSTRIQKAKIIWVVAVASDISITASICLFIAVVGRLFFESLLMLLLAIGRVALIKVIHVCVLIALQRVTRNTRRSGTGLRIYTLLRCVSVRRCGGRRGRRWWSTCRPEMNWRREWKEELQW